MENYIDSYDYANVVDSAAQSISYENDKTLLFLTEMKYELEGVVDKLSSKYATRSEFYQESGRDDYQVPDELPDYDQVPSYVLEENYRAWDNYTNVCDEYDEDTQILYSMIQRIQKAIDLIGGLS